MVIKIGEDEFCLYCMDWREVDEEGRCKVCKKRIVKKLPKYKNESYAEYERETIDMEESEESEE